MNEIQMNRKELFDRALLLASKRIEHLNDVVRLIDTYLTNWKGDELANNTGVLSALREIAAHERMLLASWEAFQVTCEMRGAKKKKHDSIADAPLLATTGGVK